MSKLGERINRIIRDIKLGKANAFEQLFMVTYNHLRIVALNYLSNPFDVDDVLSESYLKVFRYIQSVDLEKDSYNWLCKIVQNTAYDYNKKHHIEIDINKIEYNHLFYEIDGDLEQSEVLIFMKTLDETDQKLFYYRFWEDLSYEQISKKTGLKKTTIYKRIKTKLKMLGKDFQIKVNKRL